MSKGEGDRHDYDPIYTNAEMRDIWPEFYGRSETAERDAENFRFGLDERARQDNRRRLVFPEDVLQAYIAGEDLMPFVLKARGGKTKGRAWYVKTTFRDNVFGPIPAGSLIETVGKDVDPTVGECCVALEEEDAGVAGFQIVRVLTAGKAVKR